MAENKYSARFSEQYQLERGKSNVLSVETRLDDAAAAPSSGTVTIYRPDGTKYADAQAVVITSSIATYTTTPAASEDYGKGWAVEWTLVMPDTRTYDYRNSAAMVRRRLHQVISTQDLYERHPDLDPTATGSVAASGETWQTQLDSVFKDTLDTIIESAQDPSKVISSYSLRRVLLFETLVIIARHLGSTLADGNAWERLEGTYERLASSAWATASFDVVDVEDDSVPNDPDVRPAASPILWLGGRF
jgi:hypothetical protein